MSKKTFCELLKLLLSVLNSDRLVIQQNRPLFRLQLIYTILWMNSSEMENFEDSDIYQTDALITDKPILEKEIDILAVKKQFKDFLYDFSDNNCDFIYR